MMSKDNGEGKLIERIIADAKEEAEAARAQAESVCDELRAEAQAKADKRRAELEKQRGEAVNAILERSRTNAELAGRKAELAKKRAVINAAFDRAYEKLCALSDKERAAICARMLLAEAEGGETVLCAAAEQKSLAALLPGIEAEMLGAGRKALRPSAKTADIEHGFILVGDGYEKDCSFASLIREIRTQEETAVAAILFESAK